jgi:hypothetical protein
MPGDGDTAANCRPRMSPLLTALARAAEAHARRGHDQPSAMPPPEAEGLVRSTELPTVKSPAVKQLAETLGARTGPYLALVHPIARAIDDFCERNREVLFSLAKLIWLDPVLVDYCCGPYTEELRRLGFGPPSGEQQREFLIATIALWPEGSLEARPPLLALALACGRSDIASAIIQGKGLLGQAARKTGTPDPEVKAELPGQALTLLEERTLPWLSRQAGATALSEVNDRLRALTSDAYLYAAMHTELRRYLGRRARKEARAQQVQERMAARQAQSEDSGDPANLAEIRAVLDRFARRGGAKDMDRRLAEAFLGDPRRSARSLALEWGESERTVRHRRRLMLGFLREKLTEEQA